MNARHDASYKHLFSSPKVVQHLIEGFLPAEGLRRLDFATLEQVPPGYVSEDLRERADDVIWRVKTGDRMPKDAANNRRERLQGKAHGAQEARPIMQIDEPASTAQHRHAAAQ